MHTTHVDWVSVSVPPESASCCVAPPSPSAPSAADDKELDDRLPRACSCTGHTRTTRVEVLADEGNIRLEVEEIAAA